MRIIPLVIPLEDDEMLSSWMYRLSKANLFTNPDLFIRTYVKAIAANGYLYFKYDDREEFPAFYNAVQLQIPMRELFLKTTCYAGIAPFIPSGQQTRHVNQSFRKTYDATGFLPKLSSLTPELRYCRQCQCEEKEHKGFWYYHRAHQFPGVRVCHKHGCPLNVFKGKIGHEFDEDSPFEIPGANAPEDVMRRYAIFTKELMDLAPDADIQTTNGVIRDAIKKKSYYERGTGYAKLQAEIEQSGLGDIFAGNIARFLSCGLTSSYISIEKAAALVFFLFGTVKNFVAALPNYDCPKFQARLSDEKYQLVSTFRKNLIQLHHNACGTEFCVTVEGFANGWSCPKCDARKSHQEIFDGLVSCIGDGEYQTLSSFAGFDNEIDFFHVPCGRTTRISPRQYIFEGRRCICGSQSRKEILYNKLNANKEFELLDYPSKSNRVTLLHSGCNKAFDINYDYISDTIKCPHCESGVRTGLKKRMDIDHLKDRIRAVVGNEYSLISTSISESKRVIIRHNICGNSQIYYPGSFLIGKRCSFCREPVAVEKKVALIPYLSNGEYEVLSISENSMCVIRNVQSRQEFKMQWEYIIQELIRPTPSPILPCTNPNRAIDDFQLSGPVG